jgi:hypothetical protein
LYNLLSAQWTAEGVLVVCPQPWDELFFDVFGSFLGSHVKEEHPDDSAKLLIPFNCKGDSVFQALVFKLLQFLNLNAGNFKLLGDLLNVLELVLVGRNVHHH